MTLFKKAIRAVWDNKKAYIACIVLIAIGIIIYTAMGIAVTALSVTRDKYFKDYRMADVFASVRAMPKSAVSTFYEGSGHIPGVSDALGRQVYEARAVMPDNEKVITMRLISVDRSIESPLNGFIGIGSDFHNENDIMVDQAFLAAHGKKLNDSVNLIIYGKETTFNICAAVQSPEYVYTVRDAREILPDPESFGIAFIAEENLFALTNKFGVYNDISFALEHGYTYDDVKITLEDELQKYGLVSMIPKKDQMSYAMLDAEIQSNRSMSQSIPFVFVFMSIVILYLMLKRVIEQDRMQIGTMKAFGYSNSQILGHYMIYGGITGVIGGIVGCVAGYFLSDAFLVMYGEFFHLPNLVRAGTSGFMIGGMVMGIGGGLAGAVVGAKSVLGLNPAEAMRPPAPKAVTKHIEKENPIANLLLNSGGKMAIRSITRNPVRSAFVALGIMFSYGILAFMGSYDSMIDEMLMNQFEKIQVYSAKVTFNTPVDDISAKESIRILPGTTAVEAILEIPVELSSGHLKQTVAVLGLERDSQLYHIYDSDRGINLEPAPGTVIVSNALAEKLNVRRGSELRLSTPLLKDDVKVIVSDIAVQSMGQAAYMEIGDLSRLVNIGKTATSVIFNTTDMHYVKEHMKTAKNVAFIHDADTILEMYRSFMASYDFMMDTMLAMAVIVAFAIIYNTSTISLSERKREYATLRVIGMQVNEVAQILNFEYWILCAFGVVLGIPFTGFLKQSIAGAIDIDMFTFPTFTPFSAYIVGVVGCALAVVLSNWSAVRNIRKFDMVEVLKERE